GDAGVGPRVRTLVQLEDMEVRAPDIPHARPPEAVVPPDLALGLGGRDARAAAGSRWARVADVSRGRLCHPGERQGGEHDNEEAGRARTKQPRPCRDTRPAVVPPRSEG